MKPIRFKPWIMNSIRYGIHFLCLALLFEAYYKALFGNIAGDPVQYILDFTGLSALNLLILSLLISPIARHLKFSQIMILRKTFGVYSAIYAMTHFISFIAFELQFEMGLVISEIVERPYITVGFIALFVLTLLLMTSTQYAQRKLGRTWQRLHNWVYLSIVLGLLHYLWSLKTLTLEPLIYVVIVTLILSTRLSKLRKFTKIIFKN